MDLLSPMVHTYRDTSDRQQSAAAMVVGLVCVGTFVVLFGWGIVTDFANGAIWSGMGLLAFVVVVVRAMHKSRQRGCVEIRLSDDGTCELETRGGLIRLHVNQISAIKYREDDEGDGGVYTIRYRGGKATIRDWLEQHPDFFVRLEALNPAVDLLGVPGAPSQPRGPLIPSLRSVLFPGFIVIMLALLAWYTLSS
jgi:hypothetical protein